MFLSLLISKIRLKSLSDTWALTSSSVSSELGSIPGKENQVRKRHFIYYRCNVANRGKLKHCALFITALQ